MGHADVGHIGIGQAAGKPDVQPQLAAVGLCRIQADLHIASADVAQAGQFGLHPRCQGRAIGAVADVARGLAVKAEREAATGHRLRAAEVNHHRIKVHPDQCAAKADLVAAHHRTANLYRAVTAQGRVQRVTHGGRIGAVVQGGGGVALAAVGQAQGKAACAAGLDIDLLNLGLRCAGAQRGVGVTGARRRFAAQEELEARCRQGFASQSTDKTHDVTVALALVGGVLRDLNIRCVRHIASQALVKRGVSSAHFADGVGHTGIATEGGTHFLRRAVNQEQLVVLNDFFCLEHDAVSRRLTGTTGLHLADAGSCRGRGGRGVAHQGQAL